MGISLQFIEVSIVFFNDLWMNDRHQWSAVSTELRVVQLCGAGSRTLIKTDLDVLKSFVQPHLLTPLLHDILFTILYSRHISQRGGGGFNPQNFYHESDTHLYIGMGHSTP